MGEGRPIAAPAVDDQREDVRGSAGLAAEIDRLFQFVFALKGAPTELLPAHLDLTMGQFRALLVLARAEPLGVDALGERLGVGLPAASRMIDRLVQDGLAERWDDPQDRRRPLVHLTDRERASMEQLHQGREQMRQRLLGLMRQLAPSDLSALRAGMRALVEVAERESGGSAEAPKRGSAASA